MARLEIVRRPAHQCMVRKRSKTRCLSTHTKGESTPWAKGLRKVAAEGFAQRHLLAHARRLESKVEHEAISESHEYPPDSSSLGVGYLDGGDWADILVLGLQQVRDACVCGNAGLRIMIRGDF
eukprot:1434094-Rhodomonas_salina.2